jgi:hypothetical protein
MSRVGYFAWFMSLGLVSLLLASLIRMRLRSYHPELFAKLGRPTGQDSNLEKTSWVFQRFVFWGHLSETNDVVLRSLCVVTALINVVGVFFYFLCI